MHWAQQAWVPFAVIGGVMVIINRSYAWPNFLPLLVFAVVMGYLFHPFVDVHLGSHGRNTAMHCMSNQRQLALALLMYAQDHNGTFPNSLKELRVPLTLLKCRGNGSPSGYGLNAHVAGQPVAAVEKHPEKVLLTADSVEPMGLLSSPADIARRHGRMYVASFADAHIEVLKQDVPLTVK